MLTLGYRSKTQKGVICQNWRSNYPHSNINTYSGQGIGNHNYCRNPDSDPNGPWCYTTDPNRFVLEYLELSFLFFAPIFVPIFVYI
jgi:integrin beta 3